MIWLAEQKKTNVVRRFDWYYFVLFFFVSLFSGVKMT